MGKAVWGGVKGELGRFGLSMTGGVGVTGGEHLTYSGLLLSHSYSNNRGGER
jgi:hypothetical protein